MGLMPMYHDMLRNKGESAIPFLVNTKIASIVFRIFYKKLKPIGCISADDKKEITAFAINMFPEKTKRELVDARKIIYAINHSL